MVPSANYRAGPPAGSLPDRPSRKIPKSAVQRRSALAASRPKTRAAIPPLGAPRRDWITDGRKIGGPRNSGAGPAAGRSVKEVGSTVHRSGNAPRRRRIATGPQQPQPTFTNAPRQFRGLHTQFDGPTGRRGLCFFYSPPAAMFPTTPLQAGGSLSGTTSLSSPPRSRPGRQNSGKKKRSIKAMREQPREGAPSASHYRCCFVCLSRP